MTGYKGTHVHTITREDIGRLGPPGARGQEATMFAQCLGRVMPHDIGKWVILNEDVYEVESEAQLAHRKGQ